MANGKVKWFDNKKGFGFITNENESEVFVHHTGILGSGFKTLNQGDEVTFETESGQKGTKAKNVVITKAAPTIT